MTRRLISLPVTLDRSSRRKDKSVAITLSTTQELPVHEMTVLDSFFGHSGHFVFSEDEIQAQDVPMGNTASAEGKSPGQRLRSVLFIAWRSTTDQSSTFDEWYAKRVERYINEVKDELA